MSYKWYANGTEISGATASTLTLTQAQVSKTITVSASYTDGQGELETVSSVATAAVANVNDLPTGVPTITGTAMQGQVLTASSIGIADLDGLGTISYKWYANGTEIVGVTGSTLALTQAQVGNAITVKAGYTDGFGALESVTSVATAIVLDVNDAPSATSSTITILEDGSKTFVAADFGFTDVDGNTLSAVIISTLPTVGTLKLSGVEVTAGQSIPVASLGNLVYAPAANANGAGYANIGFKVKDNGGVANGGIDTSAAATLTINVTPVNDAPSATSGMITVLEDGSKTFAAADFGFTDVDGDTFGAVIINTLPAIGTLTLSGVAVTAGQSIPVANLGNLVYAPAANANSADYANIGFKVKDNGGVANGGVDTSAAATLTINVTPVNDAPSATSGTITVLEDGSKTFAAADFGFTDVDGNTLSAVIISTLPAAGTLKLSGVAVTAGQSIPVASIGNLVYAPAANANGAGYANIGFKVKDNGGVVNGGIDISAAATLTINVTPVNDAPSATSGTITILEDGSKTFAAADFGFTDVDGNTLSAVIISTLPAAGTLKLSGVAVTAGQSIPVANLGNLVYAPAANANGAGYASLDFKVQDNGGVVNGGVDTSAVATLTINVTPVNDAPSATSGTITVLEDGSKTFAAADFGFTDTDGNTLSAVIISTLPTAGTLKLSGVAVTAGQSIPVANLGNLVYAPVANANGAGYASLDFKVQDNGGVANGGVDTSASATLTINVTPVNDAPSATSGTITILEDGSKTFAAADFGFTDVDGNTLSAVIISTLPAAGTLKLSGVAVTAGQSIPVANLGNLVYAPAANANGAGYASLDFKVQDNGGVANGGVDISAAATLTINVTPVNDAPVFPTDVTRNTLEDTTFEEQVSSLLVGKVTDVDSAGIAGIGITWDFGTGQTSTGVWYWADSSKTSWTAINKPAYGPSTSIFLKTTDYLRFVPALNADTSPQQGNLVVRVADDSMPTTASGAILNLTGLLPNYWSAGEHSIIVNLTPVNDAPTLVNQIPDQTAVMGTAFNYIMPANTFADVDSTLTYSATRGDGSALPAWMTFNATTRTFTGTPNSTTDFNVKVIASDGALSVSDSFLVGIAPMVNSVGITSAIGIQNGTLNAGDVVTVSATFSELVNVTGTPPLALNIGGSVVQANYVSGSGSATLTFNYTILQGQNDNNGISIDANALSLNAGTIKDASGNNAILTTSFIADNAGYVVDNSAPILMGSNPSDNGYLTAVGNNLVLNFSEPVAKGTGLIQLFKADGTLVQSFDAATSTALTWSGNNLTINPTADLLANTGYYIKVAATAVKDVAGNAYAGISDATTLNFTTTDASGAIVVAPTNSLTFADLGRDMATIGDFNGDGYDDFVIAAPRSQDSSSAAFVVYGNANGTVPDLSGGTIAASAGFKMLSAGTNDYFGYAVNSAGDANGDGLADLVVTNKYGTNLAGESAFVVFGKSNASTVYGNSLNFSNGLAAGLGYQIKTDETYFGDEVSNAGDVNGDGLSDLLVTSDHNQPRNVYVIYGKTGNQAITMTSYTQFTPDLGYNVLSGNVNDLGTSVYGAGDVNGDGLADFIVGAPNNSSGVNGMAFVVYGNSTGTSVQINANNDIAASQGFKILGRLVSGTFSRFAFSVSSAGDVNGDGLADVMVSSPDEGAGGTVYVVYGNSSGTNLDLNVSNSAIAPSRGFKITNGLTSSDLGRHNTSIASAGDINGDGLSDMIISGLDDYGSTSASAYVVYGNASGTSVAIDASGNIAASNGFKLTGAVGYAVASAGDINGDGLNDLLVSARLAGSKNSYNVVLGGTQWVTAALDGAGTFSGSSTSEALIGSAGNDTITGGGGVDRFFAGRGDDTIVLTASDMANLQNNSTGQTAKTMISGGTGFDTIRLSGGANLDLLKVSNAAAMGIDETSRIEGIERIDMATDTAANVLNISNKDVNDMAGFNQIHTGSASADGKTWTNLNGGTALAATTRFHQMVIDGGNSDTVALTANGGAWSNVGTVSNGTTPYTVYQNRATNSQLLVQQGVTMNTQAPTLLWSTPADNDYVNTANLGNNITLQFSENVVKGNGFIQLWNKTTGQPMQAFDVNSSTLVTGWGTSSLSINPTANLAAATDYFIKISDNAIQDNAGLAYTGMNSDLQLNFSTQSANSSYAVPSSFTSAASTSAYLRSVATAGDFNGDGYDDLLVGVAGSSEAGVYVVYGNPLGEGLNLDKDPVMSNGLIAADQGFKIHGADYFGTSVSGIGDVNGDGFADVLIGASSDSQGGSNAGAVFVVYGSAAPAALNLSSGTIAAARGFKVTAGSAYGTLGDSVSGVGDVNGDGIGDFVMGYAGANAGAGNGAAYVVYGKTNATSLTLGTDGSIAAAQGFRLTGGVNENAGFSVSGAGDVNGDGLADVVVSANGALSNADGATYVIFGGATGGDMSALVTAGKGFRITGLTNSTGYQLGTSVSSAGDVNGDGYADLIVATDTDQSYTAAYVVYGGAAPTNLSLAASTIAAARGFRILGNTANGAGLGQVSGAGDINGDGFADVIVGSTNGSSFVVYGSATGPEVNVSTGTIAASQGFKLSYSTNITSTTAKAVSFAGDFDGDGLTDLVIAEATDFGNSQSYKIVFGGTQWLTTPVIGNGAVTGTAASEAILGSTTNDTLTGGGGVDRFFAGMGNDTIVLTGTDVTNLGNVATGQTAKAGVNGGGGFDTIQLNAGANLNLTTIGNAGAMGLEENSRIESIERIAMGIDTAINTLTLAARDVKDMAGFNLIHTGSVSSDGNTWTNVTGTALSATTKFHQLVVDGDVNDKVTLSTDLGFWANAGTVNSGVANYIVYQNTDNNSQVFVRAGVVVTNNDSVAPVVLDLNQDGQIDYSQVTMDVNGDGQLDRTAWAGSQDGVLIWDKYADNQVHDNSQYAFAQYGGKTDLQGLAAAFDTNHDGAFDAKDAKFSEFVVWQDANQNGISETGEVQSLQALGIVSIALESDGVVNTPAAGVTEAGRSTAELSNGLSMLVADVAFDYVSTAPEFVLTGLVI